MIKYSVCGNCAIFYPYIINGFYAVCIKQNTNFSRIYVCVLLTTNICSDYNCNMEMEIRNKKETINDVCATNTF